MGINDDAVTEILNLYGVDLTDWLHPTTPTSDRTETAYALVTMQKEIIHCQANIVRDLEYVIRQAQAALADPGMLSASIVSSAALSLERHQTRMAALRSCRDLAMLPFQRKDS